MILKVYKTTLTDFHTRAKYVYGDHVLSKDKLKKQNPRKIIKIWAEKEFLNLKRFIFSVFITIYVLSVYCGVTPKMTIGDFKERKTCKL